MNRLLLAFALALAVVGPRPLRLAAQGRPPVEQRQGRTLDDLRMGARLRLAVQGGDPSNPLRGRLRGFGATSVKFETAGSTQDLPIASILSIEESYRDRKRGALLGAGVALVGVYIWDFFGPHPRYKDQDKRFEENSQALAIGVPAAALIGAAIGWHRWRPVGIGR
jgi:hypothetical protein